MKIIYLILAIGSISCSQGNKPIKEKEDIIDSLTNADLSKYSEIERQGIRVIRTQQSDREVYSVVVKSSEEDYYDFKNMYENAIENRMIHYDRTEYEKIKSYYHEAVDKYILRMDTLSKMKGEVEYTRVEVIKTNPDTLIHWVSYYDNNQKFLIGRLYK